MDLHGQFLLSLPHYSLWIRYRHDGFAFHRRHGVCEHNRHSDRDERMDESDIQSQANFVSDYYHQSIHGDVCVVDRNCQSRDVLSVPSDVQQSGERASFFLLECDRGLTYTVAWMISMRQDIAQTLADAKPSFFRFPGGNNIEV